MKPFTQLTTSVKGDPRTVDITPCVAFHGPNESGKTSLIESARIALTGKHPIGRSGTAMLRLTKPGQPLECELHGPDATASFEIEVTRRGKAKKPTHDLTGALNKYDGADMESMMPTVSLRELTTIGSAKAREAIFKRFGNIPHVLIPPGLSEAQKTIWKEALDAAEGVDAVTTLSNLGSVFRSMNLSVGKEIKTIETHITEQKAAVSMLTAGSEMIPELEEQYKLALRASGNTNFDAEYAEQKRVLGILEARLAEIEAERASLDKEEQEAQAESDKLDDEIDELQEKLNVLAQRHARNVTRAQRAEKANDLATAMADNKIHECVLCTHTVPDLGALRQMNAERRDRRLAEIMEYKKVTTSIMEQRDQLNSDSAQLMIAVRKRKEAWVRRRNDAFGQVAQTKATIQALEDANKDAVAYDGPSAEEIKTQIAALRQADLQRHRLAEDAERLAAKKARREAIRVLGEEAATLLQSVLRNVAQTAEQTVNQYMTPGYQAKLDIEDGNCEWLVIGADGEPRSKHLQTGAQKAALRLGLVLGWSHGKPIRIVTLDDEDLAGLSEVNTRKMLEKLANLQTSGEVTQVFVATSRYDDIPAGYQKVDVTGI